MRVFTLFRKNPPEYYKDGGYANEADEAQLQGIIFDDGTVCVRWLTQLRSHSLWSDFETFEKVHGHPEYESYYKWYEVNPKKGKKDE